MWLRLYIGNVATFHHSKKSRITSFFRLCSYSHYFNAHVGRVLPVFSYYGLYFIRSTKLSKQRIPPPSPRRIYEQSTHTRQKHSPQTKKELNLKNRPLFCTISYNPSNPSLKEILKQNWHILETDPRLKCFMDKELIIGHTCPKNLS